MQRFYAADGAVVAFGNGAMAVLYQAWMLAAATRRRPDTEDEEAMFEWMRSMCCCGSNAFAYAFAVDSREDEITAMAVALGRMHAGGSPEDRGEVLIGIGADDGLGQSWNRYEIPPWHVVATAAERGPGIRVSPRVDALIAREVASRPANPQSRSLSGTQT